MSKARKEVFAQFGGIFGGYIHQITSAAVDASHSSKSEGMRIAKPATLHTIKNIEVNSIRKQKVAGGVDVIVINGGEKEVTLGLNEQIIGSAESFGKSPIEKTWIGDHKIAREICNAANRSEIERLKGIIADLEGQVSALESVVEANDAAASAYED